eukprot:958656-Amphidinium_carterae.1
MDHIHGMARLYGPNFWGPIYSADVVMRREHFERLRRRGAAMSWAAATEDLPAYDAAFPWEW